MAGSRLGGLRRSFKAPVKRAGLPMDLRQQDLRHRRVTVWLAEGRRAQKVQRARGHSDIKTTLDYEHMVDSDLLELVEPLDSSPRSGTAG